MRDYYESHRVTFIYCVYCENDKECRERYTSEAHRDLAWRQHHRILCVGSEAPAVHPVRKLVLVARAHKRTNPLFILRLMATIVQRARDLREVHPDWPGERVEAIALEPFAIFVAHEEPGLLEHDTVDCLRQLIGESSEFSHLINLSLYRRLNGAIVRNAQELKPVSDLHLLLNSLAPNEQLRLVHSFAPSQTPMEFLGTTFMLGLCIGGIGLFLLANSTNHSCEPNVFSASSTNDNRVSMYALREIRKGEELCISYIDESDSFEQRQKKLKEIYRFSCTCRKCSRIE